MIACYDNYYGTPGSATITRAEVYISTDSAGTIVVGTAPMGSGYQTVLRKPDPFVPPYLWIDAPRQIPLQEAPLVKRLWQIMVLPRWPPAPILCRPSDNRGVELCRAPLT